MNRELTFREKFMLLVLILIVIILGYYKLILEPINEQIAEYNENTSLEQMELVTELARVSKMKKMEAAVEKIRESGDAKPIPSYNNSKNLMVELHRILSFSDGYSLDNTGGTSTEDYIVLRPISLEYKTSTYAQSRSIIDALCSSKYMNKISDLSITMSSNKGGGVQTTMVITYFEVKGDN